MTARRRMPDWEARLAAFIEARRHDPFVWGASDCCLFAADAVEAITGTDPAPWFRNRYVDKDNAAAAIREFADGGTLEDAIAKVASAAARGEIPIAFAQRGDVVMFETAEGPTLGVVVDHRVAAQGLAGLALVPIGELAGALRAWAI